MLKPTTNKAGGQLENTNAQCADHRLPLAGIKPVVLLVIIAIILSYAPVVLAQLTGVRHDNQRVSLEDVTGPTLSSLSGETISWVSDKCTRELASHPSITEFTCNGIVIEARDIESVTDIDDAIRRIARATFRSNNINDAAAEVDASPLIWRGEPTYTPACRSGEGTCAISVPVLISADLAELGADSAATAGATTDESAVTTKKINGMAITFSKIFIADNNLPLQLSTAEKSINRVISDLVATVTIKRASDVS